jgi:hypothetical protein
MPITSRYLMFASMNVDPQHEALFNEVYDTEHIPNLLTVPGVLSVTRVKGEPFRMAIAGGLREVGAPSPVYTAIYELESPDVVAGDAWAAAVEKGRWPGEVRPHTRDRAHAMFRVM